MMSEDGSGQTPDGNGEKPFARLATILRPWYSMLYDDNGVSRNDQNPADLALMASAIHEEGLEGTASLLVSMVLFKKMNVDAKSGTWKCIHPTSIPIFAEFLPSRHRRLSFIATMNVFDFALSQKRHAILPGGVAYLALIALFSPKIKDNSSGVETFHAFSDMLCWTALTYQMGKGPLETL